MGHPAEPRRDAMELSGSLLPRYDSISIQATEGMPINHLTQTFAECFAHNDWARDRLLQLSAALDDAALDRRFDIGPGSLRAVFQHLYGAERTWSERWGVSGAAGLRKGTDITNRVELAESWRTLAAARSGWLAQLSDAELDRDIRYTIPAGRSYTHRLAHLMTHLCNHGVHHRAQALNMLRQLGIRPVWLDYLGFRVDQPERTAAVPVMAFARRMFAFGDWANGELLDAAAGIEPALLDRPFDIGMGSIRRNLSHVRDAEAWWLENWTGDSLPPFPAFDESASLDELRQRYRDTAAARDAYLDRQTDTDLGRMVRASPRPGILREFPLGSVLLQLGFHGTHHRAQTLNMLRRCGGVTPELDYIDYVEFHETTG